MVWMVHRCVLSNKKHSCESSQIQGLDWKRVKKQHLKKKSIYNYKSSKNYAAWEWQSHVKKCLILYSSLVSCLMSCHPMLKNMVHQQDHFCSWCCSFSFSSSACHIVSVFCCHPSAHSCQLCTLNWLILYQLYHIISIKCERYWDAGIKKLHLCWSYV